MTSRVVTASLVVLGAAGALHGNRTEPASAVPADTTVTVHSTGSALEFVPSRLAVRSGVRVRLVFVNEGTLPHNFVLVRDPNDIDTLGLAALDASETGYVPLQHRDRLIAYSALAAPGQTVEIVFEVPPPGDYTFVCLYSGHYNMMIGTLRSLR